MYRKYYSYNDMPTIAQPKVPEKTDLSCKKNPSHAADTEKSLGNFETDDIILLIVVFVLLADNCDDKLLLLTLAFIFFNSWLYFYSVIMICLR